MLNSIGWVATAVFVSSYFCRQASTLRKIQAGAALLWVAYGFLIGAMPVVVANVIVAAAAGYSSFAARRRTQSAQLQSQ
jgi:hypothetical protein